MSPRELQLLFVILGLVLSAALMSISSALWSVALSLLTFAITLVAFATWVRGRTIRSRSLLLNGGAVLLAAALWLEFALASIEPPLRWLLAVALAWMVAPFAALALTSLAERLSRGPPR